MLYGQITYGGAMGCRELEIDDSDAGGAVRVAVVVSLYNGTITERLLEGAREEFAARPGATDHDALVVVRAAGAYEIGVLASACIREGRYDGVVTLGCVMRGETRHDRLIADALSDGLMQLSMDHVIPVGLGLIVAETPEQAEARAGGDQGNKGVEAMAAVLHAIAVLRGLRRIEVHGDAP